MFICLLSTLKGGREGTCYYVKLLFIVMPLLFIYLIIENVDIFAINTPGEDC